MTGRAELQREIGRLEIQLDQASNANSIGELARVRHGLAVEGRKPAIDLPNLRLGFACKQRWEDMIGGDRVRACGGCNRPVFNLSAMTREDAEAVLATRGLTPCVRFYRRRDGTVMTSDCPDGTRPIGRRLAAAASSLAAGTALVAASTATADPTTVNADPAAATDPTIVGEEVILVSGTAPQRGSETGPFEITEVTMGIAVNEMRVDEIEVLAERPAVEWSIWGRIGVGIASQPRPDAIAAEQPDARHPIVAAPGRSLTWEAAASADFTFRVAHDGDLRLGGWGEIRTSSGPVAGAELVIEGLPPHPYDSRIGGAGSLVLRAGGNARVVTGALGLGYVGSFSRRDPWLRWTDHVVGARIVASVNRSLDDPRDWSVTVGVEVEPIGAVRALLDRVSDR